LALSRSPDHGDHQITRSSLPFFVSFAVNGFGRRLLAFGFFPDHPITAINRSPDLLCVPSCPLWFKGFDLRPSAQICGKKGSLLRVSVVSFCFSDHPISQSRAITRSPNLRYKDFVLLRVSVSPWWMLFSLCV